MAALERPAPALVALEPPALGPTRDARREGKPGQLVPPYELALADFARHLSLSARQRTAGAYLDIRQRLLGFGLSSSTQIAELAGLRRFYRWARSEGLRPHDPTEGIRPPRGWP